MKALSKSDKLKYFIAPKMKDLITFLDNNGKSSVYIGGDIRLGPAQDFPFALIIWYVAKTIYLS